MKAGKRANKGVTLAELCVVMALMAIMTTTVVTLCAAVNQDVQQLALALDNRDSISLFQRYLDSWVDFADSYDCTVTISPDGSELICEYPEDPGHEKSGKYFLTVGKDRIVGCMAAGNSFDVSVPSLVSVSYSFIESNNKKCGIKADLSYKGKIDNTAKTLRMFSSFRCALLKEGVSE